MFAKLTRNQYANVWIKRFTLEFSHILTMIATTEYSQQTSTNGRSFTLQIESEMSKLRFVRKCHWYRILNTPAFSYI